MSEHVVHGALDPPGAGRRACEKNLSYRWDRQGTESDRASSSSYAGDSSNAWNVNFNNGNVNNDDKDNNNNVRCVRRGTWTPGRRAGREDIA